MIKYSGYTSNFTSILHLLFEMSDEIIVLDDELIQILKTKRFGVDGKDCHYSNFHRNEAGNVINIMIIDAVHRSIPAEIFQFTFLTTLVLREMKIERIPKQISQLTNLRDISLVHQRIKVIPPEIAQLTNLTVLNLSANFIEGIPEELYTMTQLVTLNLGRNCIKNVSPKIFNLVNLVNLHLFENYGLKSFPEGINKLTKLKKFEIGNGRVGDIELPQDVLELEIQYKSLKPCWLLHLPYVSSDDEFSDDTYTSSEDDDKPELFELNVTF